LEKLLNTLEKLGAANKALTGNNLEEAARLIQEIEAELPILDSSEETSQIRANLGCVMIDLGDWTKDKSLVERGTRYVQGALPGFQDEKLRIAHLYNAGNGYSSLWKMSQRSTWIEGYLDSDYLQAKRLYRQAIDLINQHPGAPSSELKQQLYVNFANTLDSHARLVEAVENYDRAIALNPAMGEALGNKGMALFYIFRLMRGYRHLFLLESKRLLEQATKSPLYPQMTESFRVHLEQIKQIIKEHKNFRTEEIEERQPQLPFQKFLRSFCTKHGLFLTPVTLLGTTGLHVYADPMFISQMIVLLPKNWTQNWHLLMNT
jgi:tetratricopeptide (TPR) repeat protein